MWEEDALIVVSCVLFVQMGLSDAIARTLHCKFRILSCPKCLSFWTVLGYNFFRGSDVLTTIGSSFLCSYVALWLALLYDLLATIYNIMYEAITNETEDTPSVAPKKSRTSKALSATDEVPPV